MSRTIAFTIGIMLILLTTCEQTGVVTGSKDVVEINGVSFTLTSKSFTSEKLTVKGNIQNNGTATIYPTWYVEGDFYSDSTFTYKLGGDNYEFTYSLAPGERATWQLIFSSNLHTESDYPHFGVKNLRAFRYKEND